MKRFSSLVLLFASCSLSTSTYAAFTQPNAADVGRVDVDNSMKVKAAPEQKSNVEVSPQVQQGTQLPPDFQKVKIKLKDIQLTGVTQYSPKEMQELYKDDIGKEVPLSRIWEIADAITKKYQNDGFFISKAYVPQQEFDKTAVVKINVVEGYIGKVELDQKYADREVIRHYIEEIKTQKPLSSEKLEELLLRLNDISGMTFRAVLNADKAQDANDGEIKLTLIPQPNKTSQTLQFNNTGSRYLGPQRVLYSIEKSLYPLTKTNFSILGALPFSELQYYSLDNQFTVAPDWFLDLSVSKTKTEPGFTLKNNDVRGDSFNYGFEFTDKVMRSRDRNLDLNFGFESKDSENFIFRDILLSKDNIREVSVGLDYDDETLFDGTNNFNIKFVQGLNALGSSDDGDVDISRIDANPDFQKVQASYYYSHNFMEKVGLVAGVSGQYSDDSLYSAEEFGYGGQSFGRAYDDSEFLGDKGVDASIELRYLPITANGGDHVIPYIFMDAGKVWNNNTGQYESLYASSRGIGVYYIMKQVNFNVAVSQPVAHRIADPAYPNMDDYRIMFTISYNF